MPWSGTLRFVFALDPVPLRVELAPSGGDKPMMVLRLEPASDPGQIRGYSPDDANRDAVALVVALEAEGALADDAAATYAVLQALAQLVRFEWAAVLRFDGAAAAQVVGAFPTAMGGVGPGSVWSPLDSDEAALITGREPQLDVELGRSSSSPSPLARLPAFGLTSRLLIPLFEGAAVVGAVTCYAPSHSAFEPIDGLRVERFARRLGQRLGQRLQRLGPVPPPTAAGGADSPPQPAKPSGDTLETESTSLDEVVAEVAHQLNNPLTSILGYAQLLPSLSEDDRAAALATIEQEAERAARMVRNLLAFGREQPGEDDDEATETTTVDEAPRVLVASPEAPLVTLASEVLSGAGYAVDASTTVEDARAYVRSRSYIALVLDLSLDPGGQFAAASEAETPELTGRIIVVTADAETTVTGRRSVSRAQLSAALLDAIADLGGP